MGDTGNFPIVFSVTDDGVPAESDSQEIMITVGAANRPPTLGSIGNRSVTIGETLQFPLTATNPEGGPVTFTATELPLGSSLEALPGGSTEFRWTPTLDQVGPHEIEFGVTDSESPPESDFEMVTITVLDEMGETPIPQTQVDEPDETPIPQAEVEEPQAEVEQDVEQDQGSRRDRRRHHHRHHRRSGDDSEGDSHRHGHHR